MKKHFYLFFAVVLAVVALSFSKVGTEELEYPDYFTPELKEAFVSQYEKTIRNDVFYEAIENQLSRFFDKVIRVDLQYSEEGGFYYHAVYAEKDGEKIIRLLKLDQQEDYTHAVLSNLGDCIQAPPPGICPSPAFCCTGRCEADKPGQENLLCMVCEC
ncbi:hypothetical protein [Ascidiimonas aurantiaca]|uniref:hypothetical protein n=1 Tax=Ascidiimonas aurantiaca TaxID=1685432 RepID=UPI0030EB678B